MTWVQFWLWVASFLISDYFRERLPSQTAAGVGDFNIPTATEGRVVGVILGGTMRVDAPNCIWYGQFIADPKTVSTGIVFKKDETVGYRYRLALQYALGKFRATGMTGIWIGDEKVWDHVEDAGGVPQDVVDVANYDLFGGFDGAGGFAGRFRLHNGDDDQAESAYLRDIIGLDPLPAYRGTCYVMVTNMEETEVEGFGNWIKSTPETLGAYIGDNNQLRYIRVEVQTFDTVANGGLGDRLQLGNDHHFIGPDANPMSVAYELYLNDRWGRAFPAGDVNQASFKAAAEICYTEGIGFSQLVDEQVSTGDLQDTIEQHIDGYIGPNPVTGQIEVTLSRPDYVLATEFQATDDNIVKVEKWNKGDWSQTFNRTRIRYVDRAKDWNETHAIQLSPGNRIIQGRTVTKELRYQGCHTASVAAILAARLNRTLSLPQSSGTIILDRTAWEMRPGSVMGLTSVQCDETDLAVRITKIALGDGIGNAMKAEVVADISGNEIVVVAEAPPTDFVPPIQTVIAFATDDQAAFETPFILMRADESPHSNPRITTMARRAGANLATEYEVVRRTSSGVPAGAYTSTDVVAAGFCSVGELRNAEAGGQVGNGTLSIQVDGIGSESLDGLITTYGPALGNFAGVAIISPGLATEEWIFFDAIVDDIDGVRLENVWRSAMDTPWQAHAAGARVWFIWTGGMGLGDEIYTEAWNVEIKLLPRSPNDELLEASATALPIVAIDGNTGVRTTKPLEPISLTINSTEFPAEVDFNTDITPQTGPNYLGAQVIPAHRLWTTEDIRFSVEQRNNAGSLVVAADLADQSLEVSAWIYDLDQFPNPARGDALASVLLNSVIDPDDEIQIEKADMVAGGAIGQSFPARLEIETRHSPTGLDANNVARAPLFFDFTALGNFTVTPNDPIAQTHFQGADAATETDAVDPMNGWIEFNGAAELDTAITAFASSDASLLLDGIDSYVRYPMDRRFDARGDWTVECWLYFTADPAGQVAIFSQFDWNGYSSVGIEYDGASDRFELNYSTSGSNNLFFNITNANWNPTAATWYAFAMTKKGFDWYVFIDGVQIGTAVFGNATLYRSTSDFLIGASNYSGLARPFDGNIDEFRLTPFALYLEDYTATPLVDGFDDARANTPFLCHFEGTDTDTTVQSSDLNDWEIDMGNTSAIASAQSMFGSTSMRCDGLNHATRELSDGAWIEDTVQLDGGRRRAAFDLKTRDWTMEMFVRYAVLPAGDGSALFGKYNRQVSSGFDWGWWIAANKTMAFFYSPTGAISSQKVHSSPVQTIVVDTWYHFAIERVGNDLNMYFEGDRIDQEVGFFDAQPTIWNDDAPGQGGTKNNPLTIGQFYGPTSTPRHRALDGFIDEARIVYGAVYNASTYTIPSAPFTDPLRVITDPADADPYILLDHFDEPAQHTTDWTHRAGDLTGSRLGYAGSGQINTGQFVFGTSCLHNSGSVDYGVYQMSRTLHQLRDDDFTIDAWIDHDLLPHDDSGGGHSIISKWRGAANLRSFAFYLDDQGGLGTNTDMVFAWSVDGTVIKRAYVTDINASISANTWIHYQVSRTGSTLRFWIDGVEQTVDGASDSIGSDVILVSGVQIFLGYMDDNAPDPRDLDGWMDELRVIRVGTPAGNFTPPTAAYADPVLPHY